MKQIAEETKLSKDELVEQGSCLLDENDLDGVAGGLGPRTQPDD